MPDDLYDRDIVLWSEHQAEFLRRLAAGERVNRDLDFENIIEEIEGVGRSQIAAVENQLLRELEHLLKIALFPNGPAHHWALEARAFASGARRSYAPSMRGRLDLDDLFASARDRLLGLVDQGYGPTRAVIDANPFALDDLLPSRGSQLEVDRLVAKLRIADEGLA